VCVCVCVFECVTLATHLQHISNTSATREQHLAVQDDLKLLATNLVRLRPRVVVFLHDFTVAHDLLELYVEVNEGEGLGFGV
jgi:hypothetical protein